MEAEELSIDGFAGQASTVRSAFYLSDVITVIDQENLKSRHNSGLPNSAAGREAPLASRYFATFRS